MKIPTNSFHIDQASCHTVKTTRSNFETALAMSTNKMATKSTQLEITTAALQNIAIAFSRAIGRANIIAIGRRQWSECDTCINKYRYENFTTKTLKKILCITLCLLSTNKTFHLPC